MQKQTFPAAVLMFWAFGAQASSVTTEVVGAELMVETIVVTAQRRETMLQDTPVAMTVLGLDDIEDRGIYDIAAISGLAPNAIVSRQPGSNANASIAIRGVGSGDTSLLVDPKVSYYLDGVYMSKTVGGAFDILDIERIEVLRGPQGTLFGRNSTGGAVNVVTAQPTGEWRMRKQVGIGNDRLLRSTFSLETPLAFDMLSTKISGMHKSGEHWAVNDCLEWAMCRESAKATGFLEEEGGKDYLANGMGGDSSLSMRFSARLKPAERWALHYAYDLTDSKGTGAPFQLTWVDESLQGPPYRDMLEQWENRLMDGDSGSTPKRRKTFYLDHASRETLNVSGHALTFNWQGYGGLELNYIFGRRGTEQGYRGADLDSGHYYVAKKNDHDASDRIIYANASRPGFHSVLDDNKVAMTTHEAQAFGDMLEGRMRYTLGAHFYQEKVRQSNPQMLSIATARVPSLKALEKYFPTVRLPFEKLLEQASDPCGLDPSQCSDDDFTRGYLDFSYGQTAKAQALYAQIAYDFTDSLTLTVGGRQTWDQKRAWLRSEALCGSYFNPDNPFDQTAIKKCWSDLADDKDDKKKWYAPAPEGYETDATMYAITPDKGGYKKWRDFSYLLNLSYALTDLQNVYITQATGYNAGGYNARAGNYAEFSEPVDSEKLVGQEIGWKSELFDRRLRLNAALFRSTYKDMQLTQFDAGAGGASLRLINAGTARMTGLEIDALAILTENLSIDVTYGLLSSKFKSYKDHEVKAYKEAKDEPRYQASHLNGCTRAAALKELDSKNGSIDRVAAGCDTKMPLAPKHTLNVGALYEKPLPWGLLSARIDVAASSRVVFHPYRHQHDYGKGSSRVNASLSLRDVPLLSGAFRFTLWGKNLNNADPIEWGIDFGDLGFAGGTYARPRSYGLDVVYEFNR